MKNPKKILYIIIAIMILIFISVLIIFIFKNKEFAEDKDIAISDYKYFVLYNNDDPVGVIDRG